MNAPSIQYDPAHARGAERQHTVYRHLENDEEFQDRLCSAGHSSFHGYPAHARSNEDADAFKLRTKRYSETESEWLKRMTTKVRVFARELRGEDLDNVVWIALRVQRRIIEVAP